MAYQSFRDFIDKFDPFAEAVDGRHIPIFETAGVEFHLPGWISKFMLLELLAFAIIVAVFLPAARRIAKGGVPRGRLTHGVEAVLLFIRDQVAIPTLGEHESKRFLPFLWSLFTFILVVNLLGMVPFLGSATASIAVTAVLAFISFCVIHYNGIKAAHGFGNYLHTFQVKIDRDSALLKILAPIIEVGIFGLEVMGAFIRGIVLAVRLFANMLAGHLVIASAIALIFLFTKMQGGAITSYLTLIPCLGMAIFIYIIEAFVTLLQAYIFTFLSINFIYQSMHQEH